MHASSGFDRFTMVYKTSGDTGSGNFEESVDQSSTIGLKTVKQKLLLNSRPLLYDFESEEENDCRSGRQSGDSIAADAGSGVTGSVGALLLRGGAVGAGAFRDQSASAAADLQDTVSGDYDTHSRCHEFEIEGTAPASVSIPVSLVLRPRGTSLPPRFVETLAA